jgi:RNase adaptor protein for sRNA GlmZ degradation
MMTDRQLELIVTHRPGSPDVEITSFGVLHGEPPTTRHCNGVVEIDLTSALRNPHDDASMRQMTGLDEAVYDYVLATEGAKEILEHALTTIRTAYNARPYNQTPLEVHVYCRGGRHRSVAIALALRDALHGAASSSAIKRVALTHRDVHKPVVQPDPGAPRWF